MPLRLRHRLALALAGLSCAALAAFATLQFYGFQHGFADYLDGLGLQRLRWAVPALSGAYRRHGDWSFMQDRNRVLIDTLGLHPITRPPPPPRRDFPPGMRRPPRDAQMDPRRDGPDDEQRDLRPGRPPRLDDRPELDMAFRLLLLDTQGRRIAGNPNVDPLSPSIPVEVDGTVVARLLLGAMPRVTGELEKEFARQQLWRALWIAGGVVAAATLLALLLSGNLTAPLRALAQGSRKLAAGDYSARLPATRRDEFGALAQDFNHLAESLERNQQARRRWGADIAHELRTPLGALDGELQALQDGVRRFGPETITALRGDCTRLKSLVEDLYQLSLSDAGALEYRFEPLDLTTLVEEAIASQVGIFSDAGLRLRMSAAPTDELVLRGDHRRLAQLWTNLLSNARRYTQAPGVVEVSVQRLPNEACVTVDDSPPAVPAASLPLLFERLYRVDSARGREHGGAGLGLSICRSIVEAHGGSIVAAASPLGGLRIVVRLPLAGAAP